MARLPLNAFVEGMDSLHAEYEDVFQPVITGNGYTNPRRCRAAINVDFDNDGRWQLRAGTTQRVAATSGLGVFSALGLLLFQDQGTIKKVASDYTATNVITGLDSSALIYFHEHAGAIWWTNGIEVGKITAAGTATNWGLTLPSIPTLGTTSGALPAGRYHVTALCEDANGVEHGAPKSAVVTLSAVGGITVDIASVDVDTTNIRFFMTAPNGRTLYYAGEAAPGALPVQITTGVSTVEALRNQFYSAPPAGDGLFSFGDYIIIYKDEYLYPSFGAAVHLYEEKRMLEGRPGSVIGGVGLDEGFWTICARGAFWTAGAEPTQWKTRQRDSRRYAARGIELPGYLIPKLGVSEPIALFVSEDGLMAGLPDGSLRPMSADKHRLDVVDKTAAIAYTQNTSFNQIVFTLY